MEIARVIYPVETLGPGMRIGIWTIGCSKHCDHCINPELWGHDPMRDISVARLVEQIKASAKNCKVDGITITGGDPLEQKNDVLRLLRELRPLFRDILIYTGYTLDEIDSEWQAHEIEALRTHAGVLIDGRYVHELNDNLCPLRGSNNQTMHFFDESLKGDYDKYCSEKGRALQNFYYSAGAISVGIHNREDSMEDSREDHHGTE
jgi:anaerobic ribonucleoside-triphosphate reductase activating protein